jgi:hypothetical protein
MKQISLTIIFAVLLLLVVDTLPQDKQQKGMAQNQQMQMTEMMKDSTMMNMMMERIFANSNLRMKMMEKMMQHAKTDSAGMMPMCKMMTDDKDMHAVLTKLLDEQKQDSNSTAEEIIIKFNSAVKAAQISELESEFGLKQIKTIPELNLRVFRITSTKNVDEVIASCEKKPFVRYAERNQQVNALAAKEK